MPARLFFYALLGSILWGALAFGAEYPWAYVPLLTFLLAVAFAGLRHAGHPPSAGLAVSGAVLLAAVLLQTLPLPASWRERISPAAAAADYDQLLVEKTMQMRSTSGGVRLGTAPISIAPRRTVLGLMFGIVFGLLFAACVRVFSASGVRRLARALVVIGAVLAVVAIAHKGSRSVALYGFWYPPNLSNDMSGPFVNRNHTAGWLLMAMSLSLGYFGAEVARGLRGVRSSWRARILWFSSPAASRALLTAVATVVMAIAIVITASRSGTFGVLLIAALLCHWVVRHQPSRGRRAVAVGYLAALLLMAASWGRVDVVLQRFESVSEDSRPAIWADTIRIIRDAPWTGTGLNTYGIAMLHYQTVDDGYQYIEAHNDYLQLAAEGGLLLGIPILVTIGLFIREVRRRFKEQLDDTETYWIRVGAVIGLIAIAAQEAVDFTLQMPGAVVLFVVLAAIAIHRPDHLQRTRHA